MNKVRISLKITDGPSSQELISNLIAHNEFVQFFNHDAKINCQIIQMSRTSAKDELKIRFKVLKSHPLPGIFVDQMYTAKYNIKSRMGHITINRQIKI